MKRITFWLLGAVFAIVLQACGGGGGSAGTPGAASSTGTTSTTTTVTTGTVTLTLVDSAGAEVAGRALSQTEPRFIKVLAKTSKGAVAALAKIVVKVDTALATVSPVGGLLTDSSGIALFKISPASVASSGVVSPEITARIEDQDIVRTIDILINPGTVELSGLTVSPSSVQKGQSVNTTVMVLVNGSAATSNSLAVDFTSTCGTVSPTSALVDNTGRATAVVQTNTQGDCTVVATAMGKVASAKYTVTAPPIAGVQFLSAAPSTIYQIGSTGANVSVVKFKVIDILGSAVPGIDVSATLTNYDGGINFCNANASAVSGADGVVSFSVCAGTLPTVVQVRATLTSSPTIFTNSNILTIQTGLPTQRFFSLSATQLNFYAGAGFSGSLFDGNKVGLTIRAADRQGNPVPNGTPMTFVTEGGQINTIDGKNLSSCIISDGGCTVNLIGQNYRPWGSSVAGSESRPGRVTVLVYADGEESFIDSNNNNRYDAGELFEDLGVVFLDKNESGLFEAQYSNLPVSTNEGEVTYPIPSSASGNLACPTNINVNNLGLSVQNTCNGVWDVATKVRASMVIVFSGKEICSPTGYSSLIPSSKWTAVLNASVASISVRLADCNGNPLPADSTIDVTVDQLPNSQCAATLRGGNSIGSTTEPTIHSASLKDCQSGEVVWFNVKTTSGSSSFTSSFPVAVP